MAAGGFSTSDRERMLERMYAAFNARDIDTVLASLGAEVDWPNGWEGGRIVGREGVRAYWLRQWAAIDPVVTPVGYRDAPGGQIAVEVRQIVRERDGKLPVEAPCGTSIASATG